MSLLSKRIKEKLISFTWPFDNNYIYKYIKTNLSVNINVLNLTNLPELKNIYIEEKPIIYEYSMVKYKSPVAYGNCMENCIFQFLKIIFWNPKNDTYDSSYIIKTVKSEFQQILINFFNKINDEKSKQFILDWVTFITELPKHNINVRLNLKYDFIQQLNDIEINAKLTNLIIALQCLMNNEIFNSLNIHGADNLKIVMNKLLNYIDENYSVENIDMNNIKKEDIELVKNLYFDVNTGLSNPQDIYNKLNKKVKLKDVKLILNNIENQQIYKKEDKNKKNFIPIASPSGTY
jgi:hypothetical protein